MAKTNTVAEPMLPFLDCALPLPAVNPNPLGSLNDEDFLDVYLDSPDEARSIIEAFGSIGAAVAADEAEVIRRTHISPETCRALKLAREISLRITKADLLARKQITSWSQLTDFLRVRLGHETREHFMVLFLDNKNQLIRDEVMGSGSVNHCPVYPAEVLRRALELRARSLILAHNHPSADANASRPDITLTTQIVEAAKLFDITVHDHVIVTRGEFFSFKMKGLM